MSKSAKLAAMAAMAAMSGTAWAQGEPYVIGKLQEDCLYSSHEHYASGGPMFTPKKHTKMSYAKQNRLAKKRRNKSMYSSN